MSDIPDIAANGNSPSTPIERFAMLCWARAKLWHANEYDLAESVDFLRDWALRYKLILTHGEDAIQKMIADAFAEFRNANSRIDHWNTEGWKQASREYHEERRRNPPAVNAPPLQPLPLLEKSADTTNKGLGEVNAGVDPGPIPPRPWYLGNQFCGGFVSSLLAAGGVGKSSVRLLQYISAATARPLCGQHVFRRCRVLLISLEDDYWELQRRIQAVLLHYNLPRADLDGWLFIANPVGLKLACKERYQQRTKGPLEPEIRTAVAQLKPDIVALDPFVKLHELVENDSGDMDFVCGLLVRLCVELGIAVDVPHHVHKGQVEAGNADVGRGSSGIKDASRLTFTLTTMSSGEADLHGIAAADRYGYVRLDSAKVNIAARSGNPVWFRLIGVPLGNGNEIYPNGDTIQVAEPWSPPEIFRDLDKIAIGRILDIIDAGLPDGTFYGPAKGDGERKAWRVVVQVAPSKTKRQANAIIAQWIDTGLLQKFDYPNPKTRRKIIGFRVDNTKRP